MLAPQQDEYAQKKITRTHRTPGTHLLKRDSKSPMRSDLLK